MTKVSNRTSEIMAGPIGDAMRLGFPPGQIAGPGFIEAEEACGQSELVKAAQLPADMHNSRQAIERMGVKILGPSNGDALFVDVELPSGWSKIASAESSYGSYLIDDGGRRRAEIFYKAAFYDRRAYLVACRRFRLIDRSFKNYTQWIGYVLDELDPPKHATDYRVIHQTEALVWDNARAAFDDKAGEKTCAAGVAWLESNLPDWRDPLAYWDEPARQTVGTFPDWATN